MIFTNPDWYPVIFMLILGLSLLLYVLLDGFDLGVGLLFFTADEKEKDTMLSAIGPFWDANETWLVLSIGVLLVAFPHAQGIVFTTLYIPTTAMLIGLICRGVSFDFRSKAKAPQKKMWDTLFWFGSALTSLSQGYMLGRYIMGFSSALQAQIFACFTALALFCGYGLLGASWLIHKTSGQLQRKMIQLLPRYCYIIILCLVAIYITTPLCLNFISERWLKMPDALICVLIPFLSIFIMGLLAKIGRHMPFRQDKFSWLPLLCTAVMFVLSFNALAYSFYPYIIPEQMDIWQAASDPKTLDMILWGVILVLPCILSYTLMSYRLFHGKSKPLSYD